MHIHTKPKILKQRKHSGKGILSICGNKFRIVRLELLHLYFSRLEFYSVKNLISNRDRRVLNLQVLDTTLTHTLWSFAFTGNLSMTLFIPLSHAVTLWISLICSSSSRFITVEYNPYSLVLFAAIQHKIPSY